MQTPRILLTASMAAFVLSAMAMTPRHRAAAQAAAAAMQAVKTTSSTNVTTTLPDYDALGATLMLLRSDDYHDSGQAIYTSFSSRGSSLGSNIVNGEWVLGLSSQSLRTVYITPNAAIDNLQPQGPPAGYYWQGVTIRSQCFDQGGNIVPLANVVTASGNCKLGVNFTSGSTNYKLLMSPFPLSGSGDPPPTCPPSGCPAPGVVTVTCNTVSNGQCVNWTIEPNVTAPNAKIANLYRYSSSRGSATWIFIGQYYNIFRIGLTNP